jgi:hypothetical protein
MDDRRKSIFYKLVRLTVQIGCRIACRLEPRTGGESSWTMLADIHLFGYATNELGDQDELR